jgi:hypothetical protein
VVSWVAFIRGAGGPIGRYASLLLHMASQEHIDILRQGVDVWNQWRKTNLSVKPDFTHADLQGIKLPGADLREAYFLARLKPQTDKLYP